MRHVLIAIGLLLLAHSIVRAQSDGILMTDSQLPPPEAAQELYPTPSDGSSQPLTAYPDPLGDPPWCESPYHSNAWRFGIGINPTTFQLSDGGAFGVWTDEATLASRMEFAFDRPTGWGMRLQSWTLDQKLWTSRGSLEASAATLFWDGTKRFDVDRAEFLVGGGLGGVHLKFDYAAHRDARFTAFGPSIFGEGYFPFLCSDKTDLGVLGRARVALVFAIDDGLLNDRVASIEDLGWGLELRHRLKNENHFWYIDLVREFQHWGGPSEPFASDEVFEGTAINFGLAW